MSIKSISLDSRRQSGIVVFAEVSEKAVDIYAEPINDESVYSSEDNPIMIIAHGKEGFSKATSELIAYYKKKHTTHKAGHVISKRQRRAVNAEDDAGLTPEQTLEFNKAVVPLLAQHYLIGWANFGVEYSLDNCVEVMQNTPLLATCLLVNFVNTDSPFFMDSPFMPAPKDFTQITDCGFMTSAYKSFITA